MSSKKNKIMSMSEAISQFVHDGDHITLGGFVTNRKPYAAVHEIIRQGIKDLYITSGAGGGDIDLLIGCGSVKVLSTSYIANSGFTQVSRQMKKSIKEGKILFDDYSLDGHSLQFHAAALGVPYLPIKFMLGSDIADQWGIPLEFWQNDSKLPNAKHIIAEDPFNPGDKVLLLPAAKIDVAIIHVQQAAPDGTARLMGPSFYDEDMAMGATHCIITCEEIVHPDELRYEPWRNQFPNVVVEAVVEAPYGAHPSQCAGYYDYDGVALNEYDKLSGDDELFKQYVDEYIRGTKDHSEYLDKISTSHLQTLKIKSGWSFVPGLKRK